MKMDFTQRAAYDALMYHASEHDSETSRDLGNVLLSSYNYGIPGTGFRIGRWRNLDHENRAAVLTYVNWYGSEFWGYPPSKDMDLLKRLWKERGWLKPL